MSKTYKDKKFVQGVYTPINPSKYFSKKLPRFLSSWELKFFAWCDTDPKVIKWSSEQIIIPYICPLDNVTIRKYYVDVLIKLKCKDGIKNYLIEIKPDRETKPPKPSKRKKASTVLYENVMWLKNNAKWNAAKLWAAQNGCSFIIVTEKTLETLNIL